MSDDGAQDETTATADRPEGLCAARYASGTVTYPPRSSCPTTGEPRTGWVDLSNRVGTVLTWTRATTTPPGVREPNTLAIVVFEVDDQQVRVIGGTTDPVAIGDRVRPVYVEQLRDPEQAVRATDSQRWDGYRFEPIEE